MRVLILEDNQTIAKGLEQTLSKQGFVVDVCHSCIDAAHILEIQPIDLLLLDLGLPDRDGLQFLRQVRQQKHRFPVLIVSARDQLDDRILGLNEGADDYLCKPFEIEEVVARVHALLRRSSERITNELKHGVISLDMTSKIVRINDEEIVLHKREISVLECLLSNVERVVSKAQIVQHISTFEEDLSESAIETYISRLRKKFSPHLNIRTVRGLGYMVGRADVV